MMVDVTLATPVWVPEIVPVVALMTNPDGRPVADQVAGYDAIGTVAEKPEMD
jgi:hypothetical protein